MDFTRHTPFILIYFILQVSFVMPRTAEAAAIWPVSNGATIRYHHTTTLLSNGNALIVGGTGGRKTEIFSPVANAFRQVADSPVDRFKHTATLLPDGRVIFIGGLVDGIETSLVHSYDSRTGTWAQLQSSPTSRFAHTATLLTDGSILISGGSVSRRNIDTPIATAEIFNPATNTWRNAAPMKLAKSGHTATRLRDGRVVVIGGYPLQIDVNTISYVSSLEMFNPASGAWTAVDTIDQFGSQYTSKMSEFTGGGNEAHTATLLSDNRILVVGGNASRYDFSVPGAAVRIFDPAANRLTSVKRLPDSGRAGHGAALLSDGTVLVFGGGGPPVRYNPTIDEWIDLDDRTLAQASSNASPTNGTVTLLLDGRALIYFGTAQVFVRGPSDAQSDCLFNWAEANYSKLFPPSGRLDQQWVEHEEYPYRYRYYRRTDNYLGFSANDRTLIYGALTSYVLTDVGAASEFLKLSSCR